MAPPFRAFATLVGIILVVVTVVSEDNEAVKPLYTAEDHVLNLDIANFDSIVYKQRRAFFIEFYSSYCGACINYAPRFKQLAAELQSWNRTVGICAVNCADEKNQPLCREHAVDIFPRLKYFKYMSQSAKDAVKYDGDRSSSDTVPLKLAEFVKNDWDMQHPPEWPTFTMIDNSASLGDVWRTFAPETALMGLIAGFESRTAWAAMISFADDKRIRIVAAQESHPALAGLGFVPGSTPSQLFVFSRGNQKTPLYVSGNAVTYTELVASLNNQLNGSDVSQKERVAPPPPRDVVQPRVATANWSQFEVQMLDMSTAIRYILYVEIPRKVVIKDESLDGLKLWIAAMKKYAPGTVPMRRLYYRLNKWLQSMPDEITAEQWLQHVKLIQDQLGHPFPNTTSYAACRGSQPNLRGFSCGVWTLIHTMSVEAYKQEKGNAHYNANRDLIEPFHQFIWRFFSCEECAKHFHDGLKKRNMSVVITPEDGILWLWRTHNIVNKFIAKTSTDDPAFPKQQFPTASLCSDCRNPDGDFNESDVLEFLINYYGNIKTDSLVPTAGYELSEFEHGRLSRVEMKHMVPKIQVGAFDVSKLEEAEERLRKEPRGFEQRRRWKSIIERDYDGQFVAQSGIRSAYAVWLSIVAVVPVVINTATIPFGVRCINYLY